MRSPSATPSKLTLEIEVQGTYSRSSPYSTYEEALQSHGNQSISRLEITLKEHREGEQQDDFKPEIYHRSVIFDPAERIKPHEFLLLPPDTGSYISTDWYSSLNTIIEKPTPPPYFLNITKEGVEIGGTMISWGSIEIKAQWPNEDTFGVFVGGEYVGDGDDSMDDDLLMAIEGSHNEQVRFLAPSLLAELDYLVAHGRLDSGIISEEQIMREAQMHPEVLLELALSMPWDYARRICVPAEVMQWIEENHPESPKRRMPIPQTLNSSASPSFSSPLTPEGELALNAFLIGLKTKGLLTDEFLPASEGEILLNKPFQEWPRELQEKMAPHGAGPAIR